MIESWVTIEGIVTPLNNKTLIGFMPFKVFLMGAAFPAEITFISYSNFIFRADSSDWKNRLFLYTMVESHHNIYHILIVSECRNQLKQTMF
ncbi:MULTISPECIES: hypothetical protein [Paenibacillus]|uniref:hypothetical protein n=1 Tax=Paenibacillus TaxID=44249 RepID=UPI00117D0AAC|nr:hypothetical protein [Paenibacillus odorifer]